ncbi:MAG: flagellar hook-associated protein FlgK, partial [Calditrichaeota bacterium]
GTGVTVSDVDHIRDLFLTEQYRQESKSLGEWNYKQKIFSQVESLFNEPNDNTLSDHINEFWNAWDSFSQSPDSSSARDSLVSVTQQMTNGFHKLSQQLTDLRNAIDADMRNYTGEINQMTQQLAHLNREIQRMEVGNANANDLRDKRDLILDDLSQLVDINSHENERGELVVYVGAMSIVNGNDAIPLENKVVNKNGQPTNQLVWQNTDIQLKNMSGELKAVFDSRDKIINSYKAQLDSLAQTMVEQVNALHSTGTTTDGSTGINFFNPNNSDAFSITINQEILNDLNNITASTSGLESDNTLALQIADLRYQTVMVDDTTTMNDFYNSVVGRVGVETKSAISFAENYSLLVNQIESSRQSVQGVSLDEEMTNMIKYQQAYDAAARVITTMDQALDTVIHGMGIVGR